MTTPHDIEVRRFISAFDVREDVAFHRDGIVIRFVIPSWPRYAVIRSEVGEFLLEVSGHDMRGPSDWYWFSEASEGWALPGWREAAKNAEKEVAKRRRYQERYRGGASVPMNRPQWDYRHLRIRKLWQFPPAADETPEARARRIAIAAKLAHDTGLYYQRRAEWVDHANEEVLEPISITGPRPRSREVFLPFEWDEMVGLGCVKWAGPPRPKLPAYTTLKDLFYSVPLDPDWKNREPREVYIGGYDYRGYKVWHVPDVVEEHPDAAKRMLKEVRAVLKVRQRCSDADEYKMHIFQDGKWRRGRLWVSERLDKARWKLSEKGDLASDFESRPDAKVRFTGNPSGSMPTNWYQPLERFPKDPRHYRLGVEHRTAKEEVLSGIEESRQVFLDLFAEWKDGKMLQFPAQPGVDQLWRGAGIREAHADPARLSSYIGGARKRWIDREHYANGLMALADLLSGVPNVPQVLVIPVKVTSYSGKPLMRAGRELKGVKDKRAEYVARRQQAKRRQLEAAYTLTGYISAATGRKNTTLSRALGSVEDYYRETLFKGRPDHFRAALNAELPGAVIVAASDGRAPDLEYGTEEITGDVVENRFRRSAKAYNERLRKLGYLDWDDEDGWGEFPEEKPFPAPVETGIRQLAKDARSWILYANRRCRTDFADVVRIRDRDERRKLMPDTRSDGTDPDNGYQNTKGWQEYDRRHQPDPAEYDIEAAIAEGDVLVPGSAHADPELNPDLKEKLRNEEIPSEDTLAISGAPYESEPDAAEGEDEDYRPDFVTYHCREVDAEFPQRKAVQGFREFAYLDGPEPEKYAAAYEGYEVVHKGETLPDHWRQKLYPMYRDAALRDWLTSFDALIWYVAGLPDLHNQADAAEYLLANKGMPEISENSGEETFVRYEDETGKSHTVKTSKLTDLRHELDGEGASRFGLTERQREVFGCYYGTTDMTVYDITQQLKVSKRTVQNELSEIRRKMAEAGIRLPAQAERRGRKAA